MQTRICVEKSRAGFTKRNVFESVSHFLFFHLSFFFTSDERGELHKKKKNQKNELTNNLRT